MSDSMQTVRTKSQHNSIASLYCVLAAGMLIALHNLGGTTYDRPAGTELASMFF